MSTPEQLRRERIHAAGNTVIPCLMSVISDGFRVWKEFRQCADPTSPLYPGVEEFHAENADFHFSAYSPLELLGLITMRELRGEDWKPTDDEFDVYEQLNAASRTYDGDGKLISDE